jgi:hypothetical protein
MGLRAFLNDSLIYVSPGLDTTRKSVTQDFNGRKVQCFESDWQRTIARWIGMRGLFWAWLLFPILLAAPFYGFYRMVRRLTTPDQTNTLHD